MKRYFFSLVMLSVSLLISKGLNCECPVTVAAHEPVVAVTDEAAAVVAPVEDEDMDEEVEVEEELEVEK